MPRSLLRRFLPLLLAGLALTCLPRSAWPAEKPPDIKFETADKVTLRGTFYPGNKTKPCVILVHNFGKDRSQQGWDKLIDALQKNNIAVLSFDLRGHGDSTTVDPDVFWQDNLNRSFIRGYRQNKDKISYKEFSPSYYPMLANDLVAAKRYLDKQNNAGSCNSSDVFVIAAEESASIAGIWMAYAWEKYPMVANAFGQLAPDYNSPPEGQDIAGAVYLSAPTYTDARSGRLRVLAPLIYPVPGKRGTVVSVRQKVPLALLAGAADKKAATAAAALLREIKPGGAGGRKASVPRLTGKKDIRGTKAAGAALLDQQDAQEFITKFIEAAIDARGASVWTEKKEPGQLLLIRPNILATLSGRGG